MLGAGILGIEPRDPRKAEESHRPGSAAGVGDHPVANTAPETLPQLGPPPQPGLPPAAAFHCCPLSFDKSPRLCCEGRVPGYPTRGEGSQIWGPWAQQKFRVCPGGQLLGPSRGVPLRESVAVTSVHNPLPCCLRLGRDGGGGGLRVGHLERPRHPHCSLPQPVARPQQPTRCFPGLLLQHQDEQ